MIGRSRIGWLLAMVVVALGAAPAAAQAALEVTPGSITLTTLNAAGEPEDQAGGHPDRLLQSFKLDNTGDGPAEEPKEVTIDLPAGLGGNLSATPFCPRAEIHLFFGECPADTQVGEAEGLGPLYNVEPAPNQAVAFIANPGVPVSFAGHLRPGDQGLSLTITNLEQSGFFLLEEGSIELWGIPADHQQGTSIPRRPLLTLPTRCDGPLSVSVNVRSWENPGQVTSGSGDSGRPLTGCSALGLAPAYGFSFDNPAADSPTGTHIDLSLPQNEDPDGRANSQVKDISVALPEGMTVSPGGVAALQVCTNAQLGLGNSDDPACPPVSRVGTVELGAPGLDGALTGAIYLGQELPGDRFRLLVAASAKGSTVKLAGSLRTNPTTGRITTVLSGLPQVAFDRMSLRFDGGPDALLATPLGCGPTKTTATFTPYSGGPSVERTATATIGPIAGGNCAAAPFAPSFLAGGTDVGGGRATAFTATVSRRDGEQLPSRLAIVFPPGVNAAVGSIEPCPEPAAATGACPASSQVGKVTGKLGPGPGAQLDGAVYLTGPYRRAPYGLAIVFKGGIGPFDFGTLAIRGALGTDFQTGQVTVETDNLPTSFEGLPVRFQTLSLNIDRPGFMHNPTSCVPSTVAATLRSAGGTVFNASSPFKVRHCIDLPFSPAISVGLSGRSQLHEEGKPGLRIGVKIPSGNANLRKAVITLPGVLKFDPTALGAICARPSAIAERCPKNSRIGSGSAQTPVLKGGLKGKVYAVQPKGKGSPEIWVNLAGKGFSVNLKADTAGSKGHVVTRLAGLPDFPLRSFSLRFDSGKRGVFKLTDSPCVKGGLVARSEVEGQNSALTKLRAPVATKAACSHDG
jgi:hypothetical protein